MSAIGTLPSAGRSTPTGLRPAKLENRQWLRQQLLTKGERQIARELGCARETVRKAIRDHQIRAAAVGKRRGGEPILELVQPDDPLGMPEEIRLIAERCADDTAAPTTRTFRTRIVDLSHAQGDLEAEINAWRDIGSIAALNLKHKLALRRLP